MSALLVANDLWKVYGPKEQSFAALRGVDLEIEAGEKLAVVGKSGSGKSTLLHLLGLLDTPTSGRLDLDGVDVGSLSTKRLNQLRNASFGFVFQQFFLNARETVLNNVALPLVIAGMNPAERRRRAAQALEAVDLADKSRSRAVDLSGGQKQRVAIARAIVHEPKIILADEPTGNLDSHTSGQVEALLHSLHERTGSTLIVVTHDSDLARRLDRRVMMTDGVVVSDVRSVA